MKENHTILRVCKVISVWSSPDKYMFVWRFGVDDKQIEERKKRRKEKRKNVESGGDF